jgi:nucleoside-diphosphate-sugar epimerase
MTINRTTDRGRYLNPSRLPAVSSTQDNTPPALNPHSICNKPSMKTIVIIGGTGAQGSAIVKHLSSTNGYKILALTRSTTSRAAREIGDLPNVELIESSATFGYDVDAFYKAAQRSDYALINTDGFALGEQAETYWGIRLFELSARAGVKHLIWSGLDYNGRKAGWEPSLYAGHYEGKARVTGM